MGTETYTLEAVQEHFIPKTIDRSVIEDQIASQIPKEHSLMIPAIAVAIMGFFSTANETNAAIAAVDASWDGTFIPANQATFQTMDMVFSLSGTVDSFLIEFDVNGLPGINAPNSAEIFIGGISAGFANLINDISGTILEEASYTGSPLIVGTPTTSEEMVIRFDYATAGTYQIGAGNTPVVSGDVNWVGTNLDTGLPTEKAGNVLASNSSFNGTFNQIPEPSSTALLGLGSIGLLARRKREQQS